MNPQGRPSSRPGELLRWCPDSEEAPLFAWAAEQQRAVGNLVAALAGVAERRKAGAAAAAGGSRRRRRRRRGPGFASMGLSCHEAPPGGSGVSEADPGMRRRRVWQESRQKWVPSTTIAGGGKGEAAWETTVEESGVLVVESRAAASAGRPFGFARVADALSKDKRGRLDKMEADVRDAAKESKELAKDAAKDLRVPVPEKRLPLVGKVRSITLKQLLCGIIAGAVAGTATAPFDTVRTRVVAKKGGESAAQVLDTVVHNEGGVETLIKASLTVATIKCALDRGLQFATYEAVKRWESRHAHHGGDADPKWLPLPRAVPISTVAGAAAGLVSTLATYPFTALSDRTLLHPDRYGPSLAAAALTVVRAEGPGGLYRGLAPALLSKVPAAAASFYAYEALKRRWLEHWDRSGGGTADDRGGARRRRRRRLDLVPSLLVGAAAGAVASTVTYPLEVVRKRVVVSMGGGGYGNVVQAVREVARREGVAGLFRGVEVEWAKAVPYAAVSFAVYEVAKRVLVAEGEEERGEVKDAPPDQAVVSV